MGDICAIFGNCAGQYCKQRFCHQSLDYPSCCPIFPSCQNVTITGRGRCGGGLVKAFFTTCHDITVLLSHLELLRIQHCLQMVQRSLQLLLLRISSKEIFTMRLQKICWKLGLEAEIVWKIGPTPEYDRVDHGWSYTGLGW